MSDLYVVRRRRCGWEKPDEMEAPYAVAVFADRPAAEAAVLTHSRWYGRARRPKGNPFHVDWPTSDDATQELSQVTSLPVFALRDWLLDANFPDYPPHVMPAGDDPDLEAWTRWWDPLIFGGYVPTADGERGDLVHPYPFTADQLAHFWEAMTLFPFFEVAGVDWHPSVARRKR